MCSEGVTKSDEFHESDAPYALGRASYTASGRLVFQHYIWKDISGNLIHPRILADLKASARVTDGHFELNVADVGTGTGVWASDVAHQSGSQGIKFNVHGFDISDAQFPPKHILPENCQFTVADALTHPPPELHGTFDVVHIAHFACVRALGEDPSPVMNHAMSLLKAGGWIQWNEWARDGDGKVPLVKLASSPRCDWVLDVSSKIFPKWLLNLAEHMSRHGLTGTSRHDYEPRPDHLPACTLMWFLTADEVVRFGYEEPTRSVFLGALTEAYAETKDRSIGAMFKTFPSSVIGKKKVKD